MLFLANGYTTAVAEDQTLNLSSDSVEFQESPILYEHIDESMLVPIETAMNSENDSSDEEDSMTITEDIKDAFRIYEMYWDEATDPELRLVKDFKNVLRLYRIPLRSAFSHYTSIHDVLNSREMLGKLYVVEYEDSVVFYDEQLQEKKSTGYTIIDGEQVQLPYIYIPTEAYERYTDESYLKGKLPDGAEVLNTYFLSGEPEMMGTAIYYCTTVGDYIYYNNYEVGEKLFPIDDFCQFQKAISDELAKYPESGGGVNIADIWDLSKYSLNDNNGGYIESSTTTAINDKTTMYSETSTTTAILTDDHSESDITTTEPTTTSTNMIGTESTTITTNMTVDTTTTSSNNEILPQTGYSNIYKVIVGLAALMTVSGAAIIVKNKKETE